jgi:hypothetical protein
VSFCALRDAASLARSGALRVCRCSIVALM